MRQLIENEVATIVDAGAAPFLVGGDHSVALPALRAVAKRHGPLAVVHIDAHLDTMGPEEDVGEPYHHGAPLRHALEEGLIARDGLQQVGIRSGWHGPDDGALVATHGARIYSSDDVAEQGAARVAAEIVERVGKQPVYITFDVDGVDPAYAPGTGTPVAGGLTSREALRILRGLAGVNAREPTAVHLRGNPHAAGAAPRLRIEDGIFDKEALFKAAVATPSKAAAGSETLPAPQTLMGPHPR